MHVYPREYYIDTNRIARSNLFARKNRRSTRNRRTEKKSSSTPSNLTKKKNHEEDQGSQGYSQIYSDDQCQVSRARSATSYEVDEKGAANEEMEIFTS